MARLSDPESVLRKLNGLAEQIDAFYETADLAKQIKDQLLASHETARHHEKQFAACAAEMEGLKKGYETGLPVLRELVRTSGEELDSVLTALAYEKDKVQGFINELSAERKWLLTEHRERENLLSETLGEITGQMAWLCKEHDAALKENLWLIVRELDENRVRAEKESESLQLFSAQTQEEILHLADQSAQWQQDAEKQLRKELRSFNSLKNLYEKAVQEIADIGRKYELERAGLVDAFRIEKQSLRELAEKHARDRQIFREDVLILEREKAGILKEITGQMAWLSEQAQAFLRDIAYRSAQHLDENRELVLAQKDELAQFAQEMREEFLLHQTEHSIFEEQTKIRIARRVREVETAQSEYEKLSENLSRLGAHCESQVGRILTDCGFEKQGLREFMQKLAGEHRETAQRHQQFQRENQEILRTIAENTAYTEQAVQESLARIRLGAVQAVAEHRHMLEQKQAEISLSAEQMQEEIACLSHEMERFRKESLGHLNTRYRELGRKQEIFRQSLREECRTLFSQESQKLHDLDESARKEILQTLKGEKDRLDALFLSFSRTQKETGQLREELTGIQQKILAHADSRISHLSAQQEQLRQNLAKEMDGAFNERLAGIQQEVLAHADRRISDLSDRLEHFRQKFAGEIEDRFSQIGKQNCFSDQERERVEAALMLAESQKAEIRQHQEAVSVKLEHMSSEMQHAVADIRQVAEKEINRVFGELDKARKESGDIKKHLGAFAEQIKEKLKQDSEKQVAQQTDFRKKIIAALTARLGDDLRKLQDQDENNLRECREEIRNSHRELRTDMESLETSMAENLDRIKAEQEKIVPFVRKNMGILAERQKNQGEMLKDFGERIKRIEDWLQSRTRR